MVKNLPTNAGITGDVCWTPQSGRSPGEGNDNPLQYSCLGNPMDRGTWWATIRCLTRVRHNLATKQQQPSHMWLLKSRFMTGRVEEAASEPGAKIKGDRFMEG